MIWLLLIAWLITGSAVVYLTYVIKFYVISKSKSYSFETDRYLMCIQLVFFPVYILVLVIDALVCVVNWLIWRSI